MIDLTPYKRVECKLKNDEKIHLHPYDIRKINKNNVSLIFAHCFYTKSSHTRKYCIKIHLICGTEITIETGTLRDDEINYHEKHDEKKEEANKELNKILGEK